MSPRAVRETIANGVGFVKRKSKNGTKLWYTALVYSIMQKQRKRDTTMRRAGLVSKQVTMFAVITAQRTLQREQGKQDAHGARSDRTEK
jgi:hypothetical protein